MLLKVVECSNVFVGSSHLSTKETLLDDVAKIVYKNGTKVFPFSPFSHGIPYR